MPFTDEEIAEYNARVAAQEMAELRKARDKLLSESDIMVMPDRWESYSPQQKSAWAKYRQDLRDIPQVTADPRAPVWPQKP